jgi:hypothetical protein
VGPAVLAATVLVVVLATWAAAIGPDRVFSGDGASEDTSSELPDRERFAPEPPAAEEEEEEDDEGGGSAALIALEIAILLAIVYLLFLVVRWVRLDAKPERWRKRRRRRRVEFEVLPATPEQAAEAMVRDADQQLALLLDGSPRNGIVACWHRFEVQAEAAGFGREPWETSAEFTLRVLDVVSANERAVAELSVLYREARFSDHELAESARTAAVEALERIHRSLGARHATGTP